MLDRPIIICYTTKAMLNNPKNVYELWGSDLPISTLSNLEGDLFEADRKLLRSGGLKKTAVIFGSARITSAHKTLGKYFTDTVELARQFSEWQNETGGDYYICSGGGPGIMEAANKGASLAGRSSVGLTIDLSFEPKPNQYIPEKFHYRFHTFTFRKLFFLLPMKACILMPGGFGTLDELFEVLCLLNTKKLPQGLPVVMYGTDFWRRLIDWDLFLDEGLISENDLNYLYFCDSPEQAMNVLKDKIIS